MYIFESFKALKPCMLEILKCVVIIIIIVIITSSHCRHTCLICVPRTVKLLLINIMYGFRYSNDKVFHLALF